MKGMHTPFVMADPAVSEKCSAVRASALPLAVEARISNLFPHRLSRNHPEFST